MKVTTLCLALLSAFPHAKDIDREEAEQVCALVQTRASNADLPAELAVSIAWHESRFRPEARNTTSGAQGPMQVMPGLWCSKVPSCTNAGEWVDAALVALKWHMSRRSWLTAAKLYTGASVTLNDRFYRAIEDKARWLEEQRQCRCSLPRRFYPYMLK